MSLYDRLRRLRRLSTPLARWENFGNVQDAYPIGGMQENTGGCRLSSAPTEASNMDSETKDLMKGILNKLEDPAIQQGIRERLAPKAKAAPPPQKTAQQKAEDEAARDALLQYARTVAECADLEQDMAKRTGFKLVGGGI